MSIFTRGCGLPPRLFFRAVLFWFALFRANKKAGEQKMPRRLSAALYCKTLQTMSLSCGEFRFAFANPAAHPHSKLKAYTQETFPDASAPRNLSIRTTDVLFRRSNNEPTREKASHQRISENSRVPVPAQALPFSRHFIIAPVGHTVKHRQSREDPRTPSFRSEKTKRFDFMADQCIIGS